LPSNPEILARHSKKSLQSWLCSYFFEFCVQSTGVFFKLSSTKMVMGDVVVQKKKPTILQEFTTVVLPSIDEDTDTDI